jgi:hypothetical protein
MHAINEKHVWWIPIGQSPEFWPLNTILGEDLIPLLRILGILPSFCLLTHLCNITWLLFVKATVVHCHTAITKQTAIKIRAMTCSSGHLAGCKEIIYWHYNSNFVSYAGVCVWAWCAMGDGSQGGMGLEGELHALLSNDCVCDLLFKGMFLDLP